ncbi:TRAP transporter small permease [Actinomycetospora atypica]|uniref:TRAP transporter small permease n=1 Tax=Actinomycetospora atypica TaxID=1290095 RepID=A0ABV9YF65_9PSEU
MSRPDTASGPLAAARRAVLATTRAAAALAALVVAAMVLTITYDALARYLFAAPTDWAYPLNTAAVLGATVLAVPHLYATGGHIALDLIHRGMSPRARRVADLVTGAATALLGLAIAVTAARSAVLGITLGLTGAGTFSIPLWIPDLVLAVSGALLVAAALLFPAHPPPDGAPDVAALPGAGPTTDPDVGTGTGTTTDTLVTGAGHDDEGAGR